MLPALMERLAGAILRHRGVTLLLIALFTAAAAYTAQGIRADFTTQELFATDDPEIEYLNEFRARYGADDNLMVALVEAPDIFRPEVLRLLLQLSQGLEGVAGVKRVDSLATVTDLGQTADGAIDTAPLLQEAPTSPAELSLLRARALGNPLLRGRAVSADGTLAAVAADLGDDVFRAREVNAAVAAARALMARLKLPPDTRLHLVGVPRVRADAVELIVDDQLVFLPLGALLTGLLLILLYRSAHGLLIPQAAVLLSVGYTVALMALIDLPMDILSNVLPLLVMVYGVADAVHMLGRIHEEVDRQQRRRQAISLAMRHLGLACLVTSATTAVGFGSLLMAEMHILRRFGLMAAGGVLIAWAVSIVVVPLGAGLSKLQHGDVRRESRVTRALDRLLAAAARLAARRARIILAAAVLLTVVCVAAGSGVEVNNYLLGIYHDDHPTAAATRLAEQRLEGVVRMQISLEGQPGDMKRPEALRAMQRLQRWLARQPGVTSSLSMADFVQEMHRAVVGSRVVPDSRQAVAQLLLMAEGETGMERHVTFNFDRARIEVKLRDVGARAYLTLVERTRARLDSVFAPAGLRARVTGTSMVAYRGINRLVHDLLGSLALALLLIGAVLTLLFRSLRVGLISLLPNAIPLAVGLGSMRLLGMRLEPVTVMIYSIALGIAVDDTIHFLVRYREEAEKGGHEPAEAMRRTLATAGRAMAFTSVLLVGGFSVTLLSGFPGTVRFGTLGIIILSTALVTDLLVTPACVVVFRPWKKA